MRDTLLRSLVMAVVLVWLGCAVNAQDRGVVTGIVVDRLSKPLPGVTVQLVGPESAGRRPTRAACSPLIYCARAVTSCASSAPVCSQ